MKVRTNYNLRKNIDMRMKMRMSIPLRRIFFLPILSMKFPEREAEII